LFSHPERRNFQTGKAFQQERRFRNSEAEQFFAASFSGLFRKFSGKPRAQKCAPVEQVYKKKAGRPVSRILSGRVQRPCGATPCGTRQPDSFGLRPVVIIPLGPTLLPGSSGLPEG
jgi:hypothetical protein